MKLVFVSGTCGSGKTTLIREIMVRLHSEGKRCAIIVNEEGRIEYDQAFVEAHAVTVKWIRGG